LSAFHPKFIVGHMQDKKYLSPANCPIKIEIPRHAKKSLSFNQKVAYRYKKSQIRIHICFLGGLRPVNTLQSCVLQKSYLPERFADACSFGVTKCELSPCNHPLNEKSYIWLYYVPAHKKNSIIVTIIP
jgi:hypothetical protein